MQAALDRCFIEKHGINQITNDQFLQANEIFKGITKKGKCEWRGSPEQEKEINEYDMKAWS